MLAQAGEQRGDIGERAGHVAQVDVQARQPARADHAALDDLGQHQRIDVAAAQDDADFLAGEARRLLHQRRQAGRAGAFDDGLLDFEQQQDSLLDVALGDQHDVVDSARDDRQRQRAGRLTAMPSAIVALRLSSAVVRCVPRRREALGLHADDFEVGSDRLGGLAMPAIRPPPPMATTRTSRAGLLREHLQRDRALAGDHGSSS